MDAFVLMEAYNDKSGGQIASKGDPMSEELLTN